MPRTRHLDRFVVIVRAAHFDEARRRIRADCVEKVAEPRAAKLPIYIPALDAHVPRVLRDLRQLADLIHRVLARPLHEPFDGQTPGVEIDFGIIRIVGVERELLERGDSRIAERRREMRRPERRLRRAIAEREAVLESPTRARMGNSRTPAPSSGVIFNNSRLDRFTGGAGGAGGGVGQSHI